MREKDGAGGGGREKERQTCIDIAERLALLLRIKESIIRVVQRQCYLAIPADERMLDGELLSRREFEGYLNWRISRSPRGFPELALRARESSG